MSEAVPKERVRSAIVEANEEQNSSTIVSRQTIARL